MLNEHAICHGVRLDDRIMRFDRKTFSPVRHLIFIISNKSPFRMSCSDAKLSWDSKWLYKTPRNGYFFNNRTVYPIESARFNKLRLRIDSLREDDDMWVVFCRYRLLWRLLKGDHFFFHSIWTLLLTMQQFCTVNHLSCHPASEVDEWIYLFSKMVMFIFDCKNLFLLIYYINECLLMKFRVKAELWSYFDDDFERAESLKRGTNNTQKRWCATWRSETTPLCDVHSHVSKSKMISFESTILKCFAKTLPNCKKRRWRVVYFVCVHYRIKSTHSSSSLPLQWLKMDR